ncbi:MAG: DUF1028 domain-containing protein [Actinomycetota bacterium]|nr:DUF1028 domain-containing protein [Actinomycetota bacterium]
MTFSLVGFDPGGSSTEPEWGVAVASKFLAVGSVVPFAQAGAGAIATQSFANLAYGPDGLRLLEQGGEAAGVVSSLTDADEERAKRQVGIVDASGNAESFTGGECLDWAGGKTGAGYACQGNVLAGPQVVDDTVAAFESSRGRLAERLVAAIEAGDRAGGDRRGRQSAALLIVRRGAGYGGAGDVAVDLRVDDHSDPVPELRRLLEIHRLMYPLPEDLVFVEVDDALSQELRELLATLGHRVPEDADFNGVKDHLFDFVGMENLEERWTDEQRIEAKVLEALRSRAAEG